MVLTTESDDGSHVHPELAARVRQEVGSTAQFRELPTFHDWLRAGPKASAAARAAVEPKVARYLAAAEAIGRSEGRRRGMAIGAGLSLVIVIAAVIAFSIVRIL